MNDKKHFNDQRSVARARGIIWEFTFEEWFAVWEQSGHLAERGRNKGQYNMCRFNDIGPYSADNVFIDTHVNNIKYRRNKDAWLNKRPVVIDSVHHESVTQAARSLNVNINTIRRKLRSNCERSYYVAQ